MLVTRTIAVTTGWTQLSVKLVADNFEGATNQLRGPAYIQNPTGSGETLRVAAGYTSAPDSDDGVAVADGEAFKIDANVKFNAAKIWVKGTDPISAVFVLGASGVPA